LPVLSGTLGYYFTQIKKSLKVATKVIFVNQ